MMIRLEAIARQILLVSKLKIAYVHVSLRLIIHGLDHIIGLSL